MAGPRGIPAHLIGMALVASASGCAVSLSVWAMGAVPFWQALLGIGLSLVIGAVAAWPWAADVGELVERARSIGDEELASAPIARRTPMGADFARALIESRRRVNRSERALEDRADTAERVLDAAPEPLLVIDLRQSIAHANLAAEQAFGSSLPGRPLVDAIRSPELLDAVESVVTGPADAASVDFDFGDAHARSYRAIVGRLERIGAAEEAAVVALQDLTAIRRVEAMRADFVANASHELRTPLASLIGFIETLEGPARADPAARARFLGIMREQASRMARAVEDLLSLSRIEMEEHDHPGATEDLLGLIQSVLEQLGPVAERRAVQIDVIAAPALPAVSGSADLLQQVFRNLLENAIKYGREAGVVTISIEHAAGGVSVAIADQGEGVAPEHIPRLTERFYRVDVARSRRIGGTGLGLAIVKHILNRCRGSLGIESVRGEGSIFTVSLPPPQPTGLPGRHRTVTKLT